MKPDFVATAMLVISMTIPAGVIGADADPSATFETRCGWFDNPTPGNFSLFDRDREWIIGMQGGYQVEGDWDWPQFTEEQWAKTNSGHGYGCVCMEVITDSQNSYVTAIKNSQARPLESCRQDPGLEKWQELFQ